MDQCDLCLNCVTEHGLEFDVSTYASCQDVQVFSYVLTVRQSFKCPDIAIPVELLDLSLSLSLQGLVTLFVFEYVHYPEDHG